MGAAKILVIDDEKEICELTKDFLRRKNYLCFSANDEAEALDLIKKEHPQLVLLDVRLGDISGLDILPKIKELDKEVKVIMVTGLGDAESIQQAKFLGADDFLIKPFTVSFLNDLIAKKLSS